MAIDENTTFDPGAGEKPLVGRIEDGPPDLKTGTCPADGVQGKRRRRGAGGPRDLAGRCARGRHRRIPPAWPRPLPGRRTSSERRRPWTRRPSSLSVFKERPARTPALPATNAANGGVSRDARVRHCRSLREVYEVPDGFVYSFQAVSLDQKVQNLDFLSSYEDRRTDPRRIRRIGLLTGARQRVSCGPEGGRSRLVRPGVL